MEQNTMFFIVACLMILVLGLQVQIRTLRSIIKKMDDVIQRKE
jgi:uncharacterized membrane protein